MQPFVRRDGRWNEIPISLILTLSLLQFSSRESIKLFKNIIQFFSLLQPNTHIAESILVLKWLPRMFLHSHHNDQYCQAVSLIFLYLSWIATPVSHMPLGSILCKPDHCRSWSYTYIFVCKELLVLQKLPQLYFYFLKSYFRLRVDCSLYYRAVADAENTIALGSSACLGHDHYHCFAVDLFSVVALSVQLHLLRDLLYK